MPALKKGRMIVSHIRATAISVRKAISLLYKELDGINERLEALESKETKKDKTKTKKTEVK
jgi:hypothetical protein